MGNAIYMPDLASGTHAFHHTLDSALACLSALGIPPSRVNVRMGGFGYPTRWVISQTPAAGGPLNAGTIVTLSVAGSGFLYALPVRMWDWGGEVELGTGEMLEVLDDPLQKAASWLREGARLLDVQPHHFEDCARWISLFGLEPEEWPRAKWYALAVLLPNIQALAGTERGLSLGLRLLLDLPVAQMRRSPAFSFLEKGDLSLLGTKASRLGVNCVVGDRAEALSELTITLGPVELSCYYAFQRPDQRRLLEKALRLLMPLHKHYALRWRGLDPERAPRLGREEDNTRLGINSHLGRTAGSVPAALTLADNRAYET